MPGEKVRAAASAGCRLLYSETSCVFVEEAGGLLAAILFFQDRK